MMVIDQMCLWIYCFSFFPFYVLSFQEQLVAADHVLFDDTHHCLQMDDDNEHDTIVMEDVMHLCYVMLLCMHSNQ